jgi:hypothetical protein
MIFLDITMRRPGVRTDRAFDPDLEAEGFRLLEGAGWTSPLM